MEQDYKPNSHKFKSEQQELQNKTIEKVAAGATKIKKKSGVRKFVDGFIAGDAENVKEYVIKDVLVPATKKAFSDIITGAVDMILYGGTGGRKKSSGSKISYASYYDSRREDRFSSSSSVRPRFDYDELIFETRGAAEAVRDQMGEIIDRYGFVTVADMYDMADITQPYTSQKYGWTSISNSEIIRVRDGYVIKLPPAKVID